MKHNDIVYSKDLWRGFLLLLDLKIKSMLFYWKMMLPKKSFYWGKMLYYRVFHANTPIKNRHFSASDKARAILKIVSSSYISPILCVISFMIAKWCLILFSKIKWNPHFWLNLCANWYFNSIGCKTATNI